MSVAQKHCPKCGKPADWKTYIQKYVCTYCGWTGEVKSVLSCGDCNNASSFEIMAHPGAGDLILIVCKECGSVAMKHRGYIDDNTRVKLALTNGEIFKN